MTTRTFIFETLDEALKRNKPKGDKPLIGICFDWRKDLVTGGYCYYKGAIDRYTVCIEMAGGQPHLLFYTDKPESFVNEIDGFLIPGGNDINPKTYGEENQGSIVLEHADERYAFTKEAYEMLPKSCPVLGVCLGLQFINIAHGGNLYQDIPDQAQHYRKRKIFFKKGSMMHDVYGDWTFGNCYHHQSLKRLGKNIKVTAHDDCSGIPHGIELNEPGRKVYAVLFHPEISYKNELQEERDMHSLKIFFKFVSDCLEYKKNKEGIKTV